MQYPLGRTSSTFNLSPNPGYLRELEDRIVINDPDDGEEIALLAGSNFNPKVDISICRHKGGKRLGGVVFQNYTGESIAMLTGAWDRHWLNRDMLFVVFDYPFNQLGVKRIFGQVSESNQHAYTFNTKFGGKPVARIEGVYPHNVACIVMCMERDDCRMLKVKPRNIQSRLS